MRLEKTYEQSQIHDTWESVYRGNPLLDALNDGMLKRIISSIAPNQDALFLDAGCGVGDHAIRIAKLGYRCIGVDISATILDRARDRAARMGITRDRLRFEQSALEALPYPDNSFDVVHARGVLMHIPAWDAALSELCRVLKPGGTLIVMEENSQSLQTAIILFVRMFRTSSSELRRTDSGLEFWSEEGGQPYVVRIAHIHRIKEEMEGNNVTSTRILPGEFWGIFPFPAFLRNLVIRFNHLWFSARLPWYGSCGVIIVGRKRISRASTSQDPASRQAWS